MYNYYTMKEYILSPGNSVKIYELHEALVAAGTNELDDVFTQDTALETLFEGSKVQRLLWNPVTYNERLTQAVREGVEIIILVKE